MNRISHAKCRNETIWNLLRDNSHACIYVMFKYSHAIRNISILPITIGSKHKIKDPYFMTWKMYTDTFFILYLILCKLLPRVDMMSIIQIFRLQTGIIMVITILSHHTYYMPTPTSFTASKLITRFYTI